MNRRNWIEHIFFYLPVQQKVFQTTGYIYKFYCFAAWINIIISYLIVQDHLFTKLLLESQESVELNFNFILAWSFTFYWSETSNSDKSNCVKQTLSLITDKISKSIKETTMISVRRILFISIRMRVASAMKTSLVLFQD